MHSTHLACEVNERLIYIDFHLFWLLWTRSCMIFSTHSIVNTDSATAIYAVKIEDN